MLGTYGVVSSNRSCTPILKFIFGTVIPRPAEERRGRQKEAAGLLPRPAGPPGETPGAQRKMTQCRSTSAVSAWKSSTEVQYLWKSSAEQ